MPPYTIVGGVPARPIRKRFPDSVAESLRRIAWWDWPDEIIFERLSSAVSPGRDCVARSTTATETTPEPGVHPHGDSAVADTHRGRR